MDLTISEWAMIANALRVCATINESNSGDGDPIDWKRQAQIERGLAERIETEIGV